MSHCHRARSANFSIYSSNYRPGTRYADNWPLLVSKHDGSGRGFRRLNESVFLCQILVRFQVVLAKILYSRTIVSTAMFRMEILLEITFFSDSKREIIIVE